MSSIAHLPAFAPWRSLALATLAAAVLSACPVPEQPDWTTEDERIDHGPGLNETGSNAIRPRSCGSGNFVYVVWVDDRGGESGIYMNRSTDGGNTWEDLDIRVNEDTPAGFVARGADIACDQGRVAIAWEDDRDGPLGNAGIYVNTSQDAGGTWREQSISVTADLEGDWRSLGPDIELRGTNLYVTWFDGRNGAFDIYFNRSGDFGDNWLFNGTTQRMDEVRLDTDDQGSHYSAHPEMTVDGEGRVFVVWEDTRSKLITFRNDVYFNRSLDNGVPGSWLNNDIRLDGEVFLDPDSGGQLDSDSFAPTVSAKGGRVAVAWHERRTDGLAQPDVYVNCATSPESLDFFSVPIRVDTDGPGINGSLFPSIEILGPESMGMVWRDDRNNGGFDILFSRSDDLCGTWFAEEQRLDGDEPGTAHSTSPTMVTGPGGRLAVAWTDLRNEYLETSWEDIYVSSSSDNGDTWTRDWRMDDDVAGSARSVVPWIDIYEVDSDRYQIRSIWEDWRSGNADIFFRATPFEGSSN